MINKKFFVNLICAFILDSNKRKFLRNRLLGVSYKDKPYLSTDILKFGNKIIVVCQDGSVKENVTISGLSVIFEGHNSVLILHEPFRFEFSCISLGNNCHVEIGKTDLIIKNLSISTRESNKITIGENFSCYGVNIECHDEAGIFVKIGNDCLFSYNIIFRTSDGHAIYNQTDGKILNKPQSGINIGDHVWIGVGAIILKDISIASNSIVGAGSTVTKKSDEPNVILAGSPARVIKRNVNWKHENTDSFKNGYVPRHDSQCR